MSLDIFTTYNDDKETVNSRDKNRRVLEEPDSSRIVIKKNKNIRKKSPTKSEKKKRNK